MSKVVNKKKANFNLKLKLSLVFLISLTFIIFLFLIVNIKLNINLFSNYIELFSKKYNYIFEEIEINNLNYISKKEIKDHFNKYYNKSIFLIPIKKISKDIEENNWIDFLIINNNFKNKITIFIEELTPIAVYFNGSNYLYINENGKVIDFVNKEEINKYIIVEGKNSNKDLVNLFGAIPEKLKSKIIKAKYINNRRWDIYTIKDLKIQLPEKNYRKAMNIFVNIYDDIYASDITNIEYIDLRMSEKAIIKYNNKENNSL